MARGRGPGVPRVLLQEVASYRSGSAPLAATTRRRNSRYLSVDPRTLYVTSGLGLVQDPVRRSRVTITARSTQVASSEE